MKMKKENLLNKLTGVLKDGIHVVDGDGATVVYNRKMSAIENKASEDVFAVKLSELGDDHKNREFLKTLQTGIPHVNLIEQGINKFGNKVIINYSIWPISERGVVTGAVKIAVDITEIRALRNKVLGITKDINQLTRKEAQRHGDTQYLISDLVGESPEMENVKRVARLASRCDSNVMIIGASGTGKELIAQSIHNESARRKKPFIAENCAAIPENLLESTFFGTIKGGFTGAVDRPGLLQMADGGTLVLDEVNSLPVGLQAKLLRVLQEGCFRPVGANQPVYTDVRVISIANEDPEELIRKGKMRSDLFYRLSVIDIFVPPLIERKGDLELLTGFFLAQFCADSGKELMGFSEEVMRAFQRDPWNGNVRELKNVIECGVNLTETGQTIQMANLPYYFAKHHGGGAERLSPPAGLERLTPSAVQPEEGAGTPNAKRESEREEKNSVFHGTDLAFNKGMNLGEYMNRMEYALVKEALQKHGGNVSRAAETLGITRQALQHKLRKMEL